jgi:glucosamine-6-phosphate deaminase
MKVRVFRTSGDAGIYTAALAEAVIESKPQPVLGLATGTTPIPFYDALVNLCRCGLDLSHTVTINLDEYIGLPPSHPQSYRSFMTEHLFSRVNLRPEHTHIPDGTAADLAAECQRYDDILRRHPIDLQILGIGINGHIGFNEPDDLLLSKTHIVRLRRETVESNARFFPRVEDVPQEAITMGVQAILQAERIVLMAFGEQKADIVARSVLGEVRTDVPASILKLHRNVTVVLDEGSARALGPSLAGVSD